MTDENEERVRTTRRTTRLVALLLTQAIERKLIGSEHSLTDRNVVNMKVNDRKKQRYRIHQAITTHLPCAYWGYVALISRQREIRKYLWIDIAARIAHLKLVSSLERRVNHNPTSALL